MEETKTAPAKTDWYKFTRDLVKVISPEMLEQPERRKDKICQILQLICPSMDFDRALNLYKSTKLTDDELAVCQLVGPHHAGVYIELGDPYREILGRWASWCKDNLTKEVLCDVIDFTFEAKEEKLPMSLFDTMLWETYGLRPHSPGVSIKSNARVHHYPVVPKIENARSEALLVLTRAIRREVQNVIDECSQRGLTALEVNKPFNIKFDPDGLPVTPSSYVQECIDFLGR